MKKRFILNPDSFTMNNSFFFFLFLMVVFILHKKYVCSFFFLQICVLFVFFFLGNKIRNIFDALFKFNRKNFRVFVLRFSRLYRKVDSRYLFFRKENEKKRIVGFCSNRIKRTMQTFFFFSFLGKMNLNKTQKNFLKKKPDWLQWSSQQERTTQA